MEKLERRLGLGGVVAISISAMLGSGIFVLPGLAAGFTGASVFLAYLAAGLCVLPAALSKAELATAMPTSGGTYVYLDRTFGPLMGTISGLGLWLSLLLKSAFALLGFGAYLIVLADVPLRPMALALLGVVVVLNMRGVKKVGQAQIVVVGISLAGLGALTIMGATKFDPSRLEPLFSDGTGGFLLAVSFVFVSFAGVTKVAAIAEEVRDPERNLPAGILLSLAIVTFLYGTTAFVLVGVLPMDEFTKDLSPVYSLAKTLGGTWFGVPAAILGVLTMTSMANAGLLAASRFPFAMSRDALLPAQLSKLHPKFLTPTASILVSGLIMSLVIGFLDVKGIAKMASVFMIAVYGAENLAVLVLREAGVAWYRPAYRSPLYPWTQVFGLFAAGGLLVVTGPLALTAGIIIAAPGALLWFLYGRRKSSRRGVIGLRGRRQDLLSDIQPARAVPEVELHGEARAVVALFGKERSPEMLVELAAALIDTGKIEVISVTEVPEQTTLDALAGDDPRITSVARRIMAMAEDEGLDVEFKSIYSRDLIETVYEVSDQLHCEWLVMQWEGRRQDALTIRNPLGWLKDHVSCNLAIFSDAGVRYIRNVLALPKPGSHDTLVASVADHLARLNKGDLTFAQYLPPGVSDEQRAASSSYLEQMRELTTGDSRIEIIEGKSAPLAIGETSIGYDLIVTVEPPGGNVWSRLPGRREEQVTERAACSVLRVQSPQADTHAPFALTRSSDEKSSELDVVLGFLRPELAAARLPKMRKEALFEQFARTFAEAIPDLEAADIVASLREREREQNTAVGHGVALPHATVPVTSTLLGVFTTEEAIDYKAPDGEPVDVFFVTLGPPAERQTHLVVLAAIAKLVLKTGVTGALRRAETDQALREALFAAARELEGEAATAEREPVVAPPASLAADDAPAGEVAKDPPAE